MSDPTSQTIADEALRLLESSLSDERRAWIDCLVTGNSPMEKWNRHTGVTTFDHLMDWAERQFREVMVMRSHRDAKSGGVPTDDDLGDFLVGKSAALTMVLANMRQIKEQSVKSV
jgi:hypothetical protein